MEKAAKRIIDSGEFQRMVQSIASDFFSESGGKKGKKELGIVGIHSRGVFLARRAAEFLRKKHRVSVPVGSLDITFYRDDVGEIGNQPLI